MEKKYLPISLDITDQKILVLGGDESALKKVKILQRYGAEVEVVSRKVCSDLQVIGVKVKRKEFEPSDLDGYLIVYSCFNNVELDQQVVSEGKKRGLLVNIHDKPALCQFISPAVYQYNNMTVSVASNALNVAHSIKLRNHLKDYLDENLDEILEGKP